MPYIVPFTRRKREICDWWNNLCDQKNTINYLKYNYAKFNCDAYSVKHLKHAFESKPNVVINCIVIMINFKRDETNYLNSIFLHKAQLYGKYNQAHTFFD